MGKPYKKRFIYQTTTIINTYNYSLDFYRKYDVTNIECLDDNRLLMSGEAIEKEERITKPSQLGAFVLSFSRRIMLTYFKAIDPSLKSNVFTYTDTDSLHITGENHKKLLEMGYIKTKKEAKLGYLCSDIKNEGIIISENNLA